MNADSAEYELLCYIQSTNLNLKWNDSREQMHFKPYDIGIFDTSGDNAARKYGTHDNKDY